MSDAQKLQMTPRRTYLILLGHLWSAYNGVPCLLSELALGDLLFPYTFT